MDLSPIKWDLITSIFFIVWILVWIGFSVYFKVEEKISYLRKRKRTAKTARYRQTVVKEPLISSHVNMNSVDSSVVNIKQIEQFKLETPVEKKQKTFLATRLTKAIERIVTHTH